MAVDDLWHLTRAPKDATPCGEHGQLVASTRHGRGRRWRVRYDDPSGQPKSELFVRKADAEARDLKARSDVARGEFIDPNAGKVTLAAYADEWLKVQTFDEATRVQVEGRLRAQVLPVLGDHELRVLASRPSIIQAWLRGLQTKLSKNYIRVIFSNLSAILSAAVDDEKITSNPCRKKSVKAPSFAKTKVQPWPVERVMAIRAGLAPEYRETLDAGYGAGLRQGEALGLSPDDFDWLRRIIHVRRQVKIVRGTMMFALPKGGKERDVPLSEAVALHFAARLKTAPAVAVTLPWESADGKQVTVNLFFTRAGAAVHREHHNRAWKAALHAAGVISTRTEKARDKMFHQLRHAFASTALAGGVDIRALAEYLGHHDPGFTLRTYTHLMPSSRDRARVAIDDAYGLERPARSSGPNRDHPRITKGRGRTSRIVKGRAVLSSAN